MNFCMFLLTFSPPLSTPLLDGVLVVLLLSSLISSDSGICSLNEAHLLHLRRCPLSCSALLWALCRFISTVKMNIYDSHHQGSLEPSQLTYLELELSPPPIPKLRQSVLLFAIVLYSTTLLLIPVIPLQLEFQSRLERLHANRVRLRLLEPNYQPRE